MSTGDTGRPSKFEDVDLVEVEQLVRLGRTPRMIARHLAVHEVTIARWRVQHPEFCKIISRWEEFAVEAVKATLLETAEGFEHDEDKVHFSTIGEVSTHRVLKKHKPDVAAQKFLLMNKDSANWKDRRDDTLTVDGGLEIRWMRADEDDSLPEFLR